MCFRTPLWSSARDADFCHYDQRMCKSFEIHEQFVIWHRTHTSDLAGRLLQFGQKACYYGKHGWRLWGLITRPSLVRADSQRCRLASRNVSKPQIKLLPWPCGTPKQVCGTRCTHLWLVCYHHEQAGWRNFSLFSKLEQSWLTANTDKMCWAPLCWTLPVIMSKCSWCHLSFVSIRRESSASGHHSVIMKSSVVENKMLWSGFGRCLAEWIRSSDLCRCAACTTSCFVMLMRGHTQTNAGGRYCLLMGSLF